MQIVEYRTGRPAIAGVGQMSLGPSPTLLNCMYATMQLGMHDVVLSTTYVTPYHVVEQNGKCKLIPTRLTSDVHQDGKGL